MDDYDLKIILSELSPYAQAQVFCAALWRWARRQRRSWTVEPPYILIIGSDLSG